MSARGCAATVAALASVAMGCGGHAQTPARAGDDRPSPPIVRGFVSGDLADSNVAAMRTWGANVVRLQLRPRFFASQWGVADTAVWARVVDSAAVWVERLGRQGLKVVVDMHEPPLPSAGTGGAPGDAFWDSPELTSRLRTRWSDLAHRLHPLKRYIWGYDLLNEPLDRRDEPNGPHAWPPLALSIVRTIRTIDPDVWIIYEPGPGDAFAGFATLRPLPDPHVIYSAHFYYPARFTQQGIGQPVFGPSDTVHFPGRIRLVSWDADRLARMVQPAVDFQQRYHVPIYVGEFSVVRWAPEPDAVVWLRDAIAIFESHGWSWTYHAFREFNGWSLEDDETFPATGGPLPQVPPNPTARARVIRRALARNGAP